MVGVNGLSKLLISLTRGGFMVYSEGQQYRLRDKTNEAGVLAMCFLRYQDINDRSATPVLCILFFSTRLRDRPQFA